MKKDLIKQFFEMVQIDSESGEEKIFIAYLEGLFKNELNAETVIDGYGNLIIRIDGKNTKKTTPTLVTSTVSIVTSIGNFVSNWTWFYGKTIAQERRCLSILPVRRWTSLMR